MRNTQPQRLKRVLRSNREDPLNQAAARHLKKLVEQGEVEQLSADQLHVLQLLDWGLEQAQNLIAPSLLELMREQLDNFQCWMTPKQVSNWLSRTQDNKLPTKLIERLQRSPDPITGVNELIERVRSKLVENYDIPDPLTQPSSSWLPREVEFSEPDQERRSNCSPRS